MKFIMDVEAWIDFNKEGTELIRNYKTDIITLESDANEKAINNIIKNIHLLKSLYSKINIHEIVCFIQDIISLLEKLKNKTLAVSPKLISLLLDTQAILQNYHEIIKENHRAKSTDLEFGINKQTLIAYSEKIRHFDEESDDELECTYNENSNIPTKFGIKVILNNNTDMPAVRSLIAYNQIENECEVVFNDDNISKIKLGIPVRHITHFYIEIITDKIASIKTKLLNSTGVSSVQIQEIKTNTPTIEKEVKILIADDEENIRLQYEMIFKKHNYKNVLLAASGIEALESFKENMPDIVITDIEMPGMTGIDLINGILKINKDVQIIIVTGKLNADIAIYSAKGITVLPKPIVPMYIFLAVLAAENNLQKTKRINSFVQLMEEQL